MKRAELGLLEVLGLLVRMPGEGDVTALPPLVSPRSWGFFSLLFFARRIRSFAIFSWKDIEALFLASRFSLILAGGHKALSRAELDALSRGQTFRLSFSRAVVKVSFAGG
jgi:hypothetical protein